LTSINTAEGGHRHPVATLPPPKESIMFKRLLVPTDGSELSLRAANTAVEMAAALHAGVLAVHVVAPFHTISYLGEMLAASEMEYTEEAAECAERYLGEVRDMATRAGVACDTTHVLDDQPHEVIVRLAAERQCDLIVMGSHGWRGLNRLLLGSETQKVLLTAKMPVLVCH
jgi:nucleotide-binding universal stress UspA family protein